MLLEVNSVEGHLCHTYITWKYWHKRGYHTHSDVIFGWVAWICLSISDFFAEYLDFVFTMGRKIEKSHGGAPPGPRGSAPASDRRFAPLSGLRSAPRVRRCAPVWFFNFTTIVKTKSRYSAKKSEILSQIHATQPKITSLYSDIAVYTQNNPYLDKNFHNLQIANHCLCYRYCSNILPFQIWRPQITFSAVSLFVKIRYIVFQISCSSTLNITIRWYSLLVNV